MTEKMAKREGFGALLADGSKVAAEKIGKGSDKYAVHIKGQELAMWDPKFLPGLGCAYQSDPTPSRHTQAGLAFARVAPGLEIPPFDKYNYTGMGKYEVLMRGLRHLANTSGICFNGFYLLPQDFFFRPNESNYTFLAAVTGWQLSTDELERISQRIAAIRQLHGRPIGAPPLEEGPVANITVDVDALVKDYYKALDWDPETGKPSKKKLQKLGLEDVAKDLWP